jgi:hypothetical protein
MGVKVYSPVGSWHNNNHRIPGARAANGTPGAGIVGQREAESDDPDDTGKDEVGLN